MIAVLLAVALTGMADTCTTPRPGADWVCVSGGWLPPGHPDIPPPVDVPPPAPLPQPAVPFRIGHRYTRNASGTPLTVYIAGAGQTLGGVSVFFAECLSEGDGCYFKGMIRLFLSNASAADWTDITHSPY